MVRKRDPFWEYVATLDGNKFKCRFCDKTFAGGAPRIKAHFSGIKCNGIDICPKVPKDIRVAAAEAISGPNKRAKSEACSGNMEETSLIIHSGKDGVMLDKLLVKFILLNDVDVDIVRTPSFVEFVNAVAEHGSHYKLPSCSVVKTELVPDWEKEIREHVANVKESWVKNGCTLIYHICFDGERSFLVIFACSIKGAVLLNALEIHMDESSDNLPREIQSFVTQAIGANIVVQHMTYRVGEGGWLSKDHPDVSEINCIAHETQSLFAKIYNSIQWVQKTFDRARAVVTKIHKHDGVLSLMKQFLNYWELKQSSTTEFYSNYYMLQSVMGVESELRSLVSSPQWLSLVFEQDESGVKVDEIIHSSEFWSEGKEVLHVLKPIFRVLCLVDGYTAPSGFLYAAVKMADETIRIALQTDVLKYEHLGILFDKWRENVIHPIHAAAAYLNPTYMFSDNFEKNGDMIKGLDFICKNLVAGDDVEAFLLEMVRYGNKESELFTGMALTMSRTCHPRDWWDHCGGVLPVLKKYAIRILSQPCSTSFCSQTLSAFETAQTKKREPSMPAVMDDYLYLRTNVLVMENFKMMEARSWKPPDLVKLGELPNFTEFINENLTRDLLNKTKVPLSDGKLNCWSASARKDGESEKCLQLHFLTKLPSRLVRGVRVEGERGGPIHVILVDSSTGRFVQSGPISELELKLTVIGGDFDKAASKTWSREFFGRNEMMGQEGNMPLLTGDISVILERGVGTLGAITFNDVSSWTRSGKFRLGVKTASASFEGIRVLEGTSNAFTVEDAIRVGMAHANNLPDRMRMPEGSRGPFRETVSVLGDAGHPLPPTSSVEQQPLEILSSSEDLSEDSPEDSPEDSSDEAVWSPSEDFWVRKEKRGGRITALHQLVSPFGKTDTESVFCEAIEYIKFLHDQVNVLFTPYMRKGAPVQHQQYCDKLKDHAKEGPEQDLWSQGLCLVPISSTFPVAHETPVDFWSPTFGGSFR